MKEEVYDLTRLLGRMQKDWYRKCTSSIIVVVREVADYIAFCQADSLADLDYSLLYACLSRAIRQWLDHYYSSMHDLIPLPNTLPYLCTPSTIPASFRNEDTPTVIAQSQLVCILQVLREQQTVVGRYFDFPPLYDIHSENRNILADIVTVMVFRHMSKHTAVPPTFGAALIELLLADSGIKRDNLFNDISVEGVFGEVFPLYALDVKGDSPITIEDSFNTAMKEYETWKSGQEVRV